MQRLPTHGYILGESCAVNSCFHNHLGLAWMHGILRADTRAEQGVACVPVGADDHHAQSRERDACRRRAPAHLVRRAHPPPRSAPRTAAPSGAGRVRGAEPQWPDEAYRPHGEYSLHKHFSSVETIEHVAVQCRSAGWGCLDCKRVLSQGIEEKFAPMRERAAALQEDPAQVHAILQAGADRARAVAQTTMAEVRERMGFLLPEQSAVPE